MPSITIDIYWVDDNGDFRVDENGDYLIWDSLDEQFTWLRTYRKSLVAQRGIKSFNITEQADGSYVTKINKSCFLGRYSTRELALGALVNAFFCNEAGSLEDISATMGIQLSLGRSTLEGVSIPAPVETASTSYFSLAPSFQFTGNVLGSGANETTEGAPGSFYRTNAPLRDDGITPDFPMDSVMAGLGESTSTAWTILPDNFGMTTWAGFDIDNWNGTDPLPQMGDAAGVQTYVDYLQSVIDQGYLPDFNGVAVLIDWESDTAEVSRKGNIFWKATDTRYRDMLREMRSQQRNIIAGLRDAFPGILLGCYGAVCSAPASGEMKVVGNDFDPSGSNIRYWSMPAIQNNPTRKALLRDSYIESLTDTVSPLPDWDFHTHIAYDYFGRNGIATYDTLIADGDYDAGNMRPEWKKEELSYFTLLLDEVIPDVPRLGIISPSNVAATYQQNPVLVPLPSQRKYAWTTPYDWVHQTIDFIKDMDGYFIWDNLRAEQYKTFTNNFEGWANVTNKSLATDYWKVIEDLEEQFGFLTEWANEKGVSPLPTSAQEWFGVDKTKRAFSWELPGTLSDPSDPVHVTKNGFVKDIIPDLRDTLMPLLEQWRTTGVVPFDEVAPAANLDAAAPGIFTNVNLTESGFAVFSDDPFPVAGYAMQATSVGATLNWVSAESVKTSITTSSVFTFTISGVSYVVSPSTATATETAFTDADLLSALLDPFNYIIDSVTVA